MPAPSKPRLCNPRHPARTLLYQTVAEQYETWHELASAGQFDGQGDHHSPKPCVRKAFAKYLECGIFAHASMRCPLCCAPSVASRCASSRSSRTVLTSTKYSATSGWMQSRRASRRHAGQRCGAGLRLAMLRRETCRTVSDSGPQRWLEATRLSDLGDHRVCCISPHAVEFSIRIGAEFPIRPARRKRRPDHHLGLGPSY